MRSGRKPPVLRSGYKSLAAGIVVQVVTLLDPERLRFDLLGVKGGLPESAVPIRACRLKENAVIAAWHEAIAVIDQLSRSELPKVRQSGFERCGVECLAEEDGMEVRRHYHVGIDAKTFVLVTEIQAVGDDLARLLVNKNGQLIDHGQCHEVNRAI